MPNRQVCIHGDIYTPFLVILSSEQVSMHTCMCGHMFMLFAQKAGLYTCKHIYNKYVYANRSVCIHGDIATLFLVILSTEQGSLYTWRYLHSTYVYAICPTHVHYGCLFNLPNGQACIHADICTACHFMISA